MRKRPKNKKSIYELALEETAKQRKKSKRKRKKKKTNAPVFETLDPKALDEYLKNLEKSGPQMPPSMPPNVFRQGMSPSNIVVDGAFRRRPGGTGRNIQLD